MTTREYWDVGTFIKRPGQEKAFFQKLGSATPNERGGFWINLDALPIPNTEGRVTMVMSPPRERTTAAPLPRRQEAAPRRSSFDDDEVPF